jgi:hypothetical protein
MEHARRILARGVDRAVDGKARRIDLVRRLHDLVAVEIYLHQVRCGDLVESHPVGVNQEMMIRAWNTGRQIG